MLPLFLFALIIMISNNNLMAALVTNTTSPRSSFNGCGTAATCSSSSSMSTSKTKFAYETSKTYHYKLESSIRTATSNPASKQTGLRIRASATIGAITACQLQLQLADVHLADDDDDLPIQDRRFVDALRHPVRFEWHDGRIGDVCPSSSADTAWSLNFKRAILSAMQNSMDTLDNPEPTREIDAAGDCWANYETVVPASKAKAAKQDNDDVIITVQRTKDLNQCADRDGGLTALFGVKYANPMSDINTLPLTDGKQTCTQSTDQTKIIRIAECRERLQLLATRLQDGAVSVVSEATMRLTLGDIVDKPIEPAPIAAVTDLKFDHSYIAADSDGDAKDAATLLGKMCRNDGVVTESGRELSDLVDSLRSLTKDQIANVYDEAVKCKATAKILLSVMPDVGTAESALFIVERVAAKDPPSLSLLSSSLVREDWMASLRTVRLPSVDLLEPAAALVTASDEFAISGRAYLGVGSAIHNFCYQNSGSGECANNDKVKTAIGHFARQLVQVCKPGAASPVSSEAARKAIYALRALGNAGSAIAHATDVVSQCQVNKALPADLRIAALAAMRRVPCIEESLTVAENLRALIRDFNEDSELRAIAFLAAMRCPSLEHLAAIRAVITDDARKVSEKLGAFIVSYLDRFDATPFPMLWSREISASIGSLLRTQQAVELAQKVDALKRGATYHRHQFLPRLNAGFMYDIGVIHSEKSIMPRQFLFNLTVGLFGRSVNPLEFGLRQEGLESLIDDLPTDIVETSKPQSPPNGTNVPRLSADKLKPILERLKLGFFVRIFGDEVAYAQVDKGVLDRFKTRLSETFNPEMLFSEEGRQASELFFDRAVSLPTCSGLPLRLSLRGTYRSQVRPNMKPEVKRGPDGRLQAIAIKADVKAGLSIELRSSMAAFLGGRQFGIQAVTRIVSKAEYKPEFVYEGRHIKLRVDLPEKTIRAASVSNQVFLRRDKAEEPIVVDVELRQRRVCTPDVAGLRMCFRSDLPSRWNGIMTPGQLGLLFEKIDPATKSVELEFQADHSVGADGKVDSIDFKAFCDTPGSATNHKLLAALHLSRPDGKFELALETPWKMATLKLEATNSAETSDVSASLEVGDTGQPLKYNLAIKRTFAEVKEGEQLHPKRTVTIEVKRLDVVELPLFKASGSITDITALKEVAVSIANLRIPNVYTLPKPLSLKGEVGHSATRGYGFILKGQTPSRDFETEFGVKLEPAGSQIVYSHRLHHQSVRHEDQEDAVESVLLWEVEFSREPSRSLLVKSLLRTANMPLVETLEHRLALVADRPTPEDYVSSLEVDVGAGKNLKRYKVAQKLSQRAMPTSHGFDFSLTVSAPAMIDRTVSLNYSREWEPENVFFLEAELRRGDVALYQAVLYGRRDDPGFGEFRLRTLCPYSDFLVHGKGEKVDDYIAKHSFRIERNGDLRVSFESTAAIQGDSHSVDASIVLFGMLPLSLSSRGTGNPLSGKFVHDGVVAFGPRRLLFGCEFNHRPKSELESSLDINVYLGNLQSMFKQHLGYQRQGRSVTLIGMTELGDGMYKMTGQLDLAARRYAFLVEGPRSASELHVAFSSLDGYDFAFSHHCPNVEVDLNGQAHFDRLRSDLVGFFAYKQPKDKNVKKVIGFNLGHKADFSAGLDVAFTSGIRINDKEWFAHSNVTVIPSQKLSLSIGIGNSDVYRHVFTVMLGRRRHQQSDHRELHIDGAVEFHTTALEMPRLKCELANWKISWRNSDGRLGGCDGLVRFNYGNYETWCSVNIDAANPNQGMAIAVNGQSPFSERTELKFAYTVSLPTITFSGNARYGEKAGRIRGLIEVKAKTADYPNWVDIAYSVAVYSSTRERAEITIRGKHAGDVSSKSAGFITVEIRDASPYAIYSQWNNEKDQSKMVEIVVRTPLDNFQYNMVKMSGDVNADRLSGRAEVVLRIGDLLDVRSSVWRQVEPKSNRGELKLEINRNIYSAGFALDHPEVMFSRGEHRLRLRVDTPLDGYRTSTMLLWFNPCSQGFDGIAAVLGLAAAETESPEITEQRSQMQMAYQIGDNNKGGVLISARGERNYDQQAWKLSIVVDLPPFANASFDVELNQQSAKRSGWAELRSQRYGKWRSDWLVTGNLQHAGSVQLDIRGGGEDDAAIIVRLLGNHALSNDANKHKEASGQLTTNIRGYEQVRLQLDQGLDDEDNIVVNFNVKLPSSKTIKTKLTLAITMDRVDVKFDITTPYPQVAALGGQVNVHKNSNNFAVNVKYYRNELYYDANVKIGITKPKQLTGSLAMATPFNNVTCNLVHSGDWKDGWKTRFDAETWPSNWTLLFESEAGENGDGKFVSVIVTSDDAADYRFVVNKEPGRFELRLPTHYGCLLHYDGEITTVDNVFMAVRRHGDCFPQGPQGDVTLQLGEPKQLLVNVETPLSNWNHFFLNLTYVFDEATYQIEEKLPPIEVYFLVKREDDPLSVKAIYLPDDAIVKAEATFRDFNLAANGLLGKDDKFEANAELQTPWATIVMQNLCDGPLTNPSDFKSNFQVMGFSFYDIYGKWNVANLPTNYNVELSGTVYSKATELLASGSISAEALLFNWKNEIDATFHRTQARLTTSVDVKNNARFAKMDIKFELPRQRQEIVITTGLEVTDDGVESALTLKGELGQKGFLTKSSSSSPFKNAVATVGFSVPSSAANPLSPPWSFVVSPITALSKFDWNSKLVVDGVEKFGAHGILKVDMMSSSLANGAGFKVFYEAVHSSWPNKRYHLLVTTTIPATAKSAELKLEFDENETKLLQLACFAEKRGESWLRYGRLKIDLDLPMRQMTFDIERRNDSKWQAFVNLDRINDAEGTLWQFDIQPSATTNSGAGLDLALKATRTNREVLLIEAGFDYQPRTNPTPITYYLYGKTANMAKKYGFKTKISLVGAVATLVVDFATLTREIGLTIQAGRDFGGIFLRLEHDLGDPDKKLRAKIAWLGDNVNGFFRCGPKQVTFKGMMNIVDRHNYVMTVDASDNDNNTANFQLRNAWSPQTRNNTLEASLKTNHGTIEMCSHRYVADPIRSRGLLVRYQRNDWPPGRQVVLWAFGEVDLATPNAKFHLLTPFRTADYTITTERRDNGVKEVIAVITGDNGRPSRVNLELDPTQPSFDLVAQHSDGSRFKIHGHVVSTQYAFIEAKRKLKQEIAFENLARLTVRLDPRFFNATVNHHPDLVEIAKQWIVQRRVEASELLSLYSKHIPKGVESLRHIELLDKVLVPFVDIVSKDRLQLNENERKQWRIISKEWLATNGTKQSLGLGLTSYLDQLFSRWLVEQKTTTPGPDDVNKLSEKLSPDRAIFAIGRSVRSYFADDFLPDWARLRQGEVAELADGQHTIRNAIIKVVDASHDYAVEAYDRFADYTWASCFVHYAQMVNASFYDTLEQLNERQDFREWRDNLMSAIGQLRLALKHARNAAFAAPLPNQPSPLLAGLQDTIANSSFTYDDNQFDACIVLPSRELGSLRAPAVLARQAEDLRQFFERSFASMQKRIATHGPMSQLTLQRWYGLVQYYRAGELKFLPPLSAQAMIIGSPLSVNNNNNGDEQAAATTITASFDQKRRRRHRRFTASAADLPPGVDIVTFDGLAMSLVSPINNNNNETQRLVLLYDRIRSAPRILLTLRKAGKWSVTTLVDGKSIEMDPLQERVFVDGKLAEMPIQAKTTRVRRNGPELQLQSRLGFEVICNVEFGYCRVIIDGVRFGVQAGVLGTFSGDAADDMLSSDGQLLNDLGEFLCSWQVLSPKEETCDRKTIRSSLINSAGALINDDDNDDDDGDGDFLSWMNTEAIYKTPQQEDDNSRQNAELSLSMCQRLFRSSRSPMVDCYGKVEPAPFYHACQRRVHGNRHSRHRAACGVAFAYASHCRHAGIHVRPPKSCVQCKPTMAALDVLVGEPRPQTVEIPVRSADVVFIGDESSSSCEAFHLPWLVANLTLKINAALLHAGMADNRYSYVGYGGDSAVHREPHFHTFAGGQLWVGADEMSQQVDKTITASRPRSARVRQWQQGDALSAVNLAVSSAWRIGARRTLVLLSCQQSSCLEQAVSLESLKAHFELNRIVMHFLGPAKLPRVSAGDALVGFDSRSLFTVKNSPKGNTSIEMWRSFSDRPDDACSRLAVSMLGSFWSIDAASSSWSSDAVMTGLAYRLTPAPARQGAAAAAAVDCEHCACTLADYSATDGSNTYYDPAAVPDCYRCLQRNII